ncbi:MAG TPA: metal-dependent hydrolase [Vicinamibacterales bacterium]|jgi:membrane-bound metal-dependent hydrolase YbcI (DUF457 family)
MPVIGHAFVGLATAARFEPATGPARRATSPIGAALWMPLLVVLAYFPDIVTQAGLASGWPRASLAGHSILFGAIAGVGIGLLWTRAFGGPPRYVVGLAVGSILFHDLLDLLQATDRAPLWPFSRRMLDAGWLALPNRSTSELLVFGIPCAAYIVWRARRHPVPRRVAGSERPALLWLTRAIVGGLVIAALATQTVRRTRERQVNEAERLLRRGEYRAAIEAADRADAWPSTARPGRIDVIRGEAHEALGDGKRAETFYRRAYENDPLNFWAVADLAEYYAACDRPLDERRRLAQQYLGELHRFFPGSADLADVSSRVEQKLARPRPGASSGP